MCCTCTVDVHTICTYEDYIEPIMHIAFTKSSFSKRKKNGLAKNLMYVRLVVQAGCVGSMGVF